MNALRYALLNTVSDNAMAVQLRSKKQKLRWPGDRQPDIYTPETIELRTLAMYGKSKPPVMADLPIGVYA